MDAREVELRRLDIPIVNTYIDDALLLESLSSEKTMKDFINHREMMNAIPLVSIARVVWGRDLSTKFEKLSTFDEIEQRYGFVRSPETEAEVGMAILWNLAMLGQLRDDQHDESYDRVRGIRTFATELPAEEQDDLRNQYMNRARDLGFGPALVFDRFTNAFARNKVRATKYISRLGEGVTEQIIQKRGVQTLQEVWGMQGGI